MGIDDVFAVIAERTRRDILESLRSEGKSVGQLVGELEVSQPTVSKHLKVLREAGLVTMRAQGQKRFYSLEAAPLGTVKDWLATFTPEQTAGTVQEPAGEASGHSAGSAVEVPVQEAVPAAAEPAEAQVVGALAAAALAAPEGSAPGAADATRQQQIGRTMGRAAERAADLISQLRRRKDSER